MSDKIREAFNQWLSTANDADFVTLETAWTAGYQARDRELRAELEAAKKDAERYRWLIDKLLGADFDWNESGSCALVFEWPSNVPVGGNFDMNIDAAMSEVK